MERLLTIRGVLTGLALLGLVLSPFARPATAADGTVAQASMAADAAIDMADMPCCPDQAPMPDCGKDCRFMAACSAPSVCDTPRGTVLAVPLVLASPVVPDNDAGLSGLSERPPPRPPKI